MSNHHLTILLASHEGEQFYNLLNDVSNVSIREAVPGQITQDDAADIDILYGHPSREILEMAPKLKWIQASSAGVEFVARIPELVNSDIILTNTRGAHGPSIGEHTFALLLAMTRHIPESLDQDRRHHWERGALYRTAREIGGLTMGIIGFGALGKGVAMRAPAFDLKVLAVDAQAVDGAGLVEEVWPVSRLDDLLAASDIVVVTAPLTPETHHMIGAEQLARMKHDAYLIVVSRGGIVVEDALIEALKDGKLAGAALDVTEQEPLPADSPLWETPRLLMTPHLAGASARKERRCVEIFKENLLRYQQGDALINVVDKSRGY